MIERCRDEFPIPAATLNPDEVVALGLAVQAGLEMDDAALDEMVMTDVCPYTLGINTVEGIGNNGFMSGFYLPIIERNTVVPASRSRDVFTVSDGQTKVAVEVFPYLCRVNRPSVFVDGPPETGQARQRNQRRQAE